jgi:glyoxylase-like metal-dependent hydrolase (beta-lactamase superfamily II)
MNHGIHTIDTGFVRPRMDAAYLIVESGRGAFVDCGTSHAAGHLLQALREAGLTPDQVDWLIVTHVHLDHGGGAGELLARLPNARLLVHPRGARHMIDPSQLWAGASAVYGAAVMEATYGKLRPVPAERVVQATDGYVAQLSGRPLRCLDTPGHARHHLCVHDERANVCFTGDTFGLSYRELDTDQGAFVLPTTTPVQFDPDALHASIDRLVALQPTAMYLTHYGRVTDVQRHATGLHEQIGALVAIAETMGQQTATPAERHRRIKQALTDFYAVRLSAHGWHGDRAALQALIGMDMELNAQGLGVWLDSRTC